MDSKDEADEIRKFIEDVKKRKRPVQISDFKSFAVAIISLHTVYIYIMFMLQYS